MLKREEPKELATWRDEHDSRALMATGKVDVGRKSPFGFLRK